MPKPINGLTLAARAAGMKRGGYVPSHMIRWRVGNMHVGTSALTVAREFWHVRAKALATPLKRACVRAALLEHRANQALYGFVMRGKRS